MVSRSPAPGGAGFFATGGVGLAGASVRGVGAGDCAAASAAPATTAQPQILTIVRSYGTGALLLHGPGGVAQPVVRGVLVCLAERGVVEDGLDEVVDRAAEGQAGLADVDELGGHLAQDV